MNWHNKSTPTEGKSINKSNDWYLSSFTSLITSSFVHRKKLSPLSEALDWLKPMERFVHFESCLTNVRFNFRFKPFYSNGKLFDSVKHVAKVEQFDNIPPTSLERKLD
ncbi:MAG: hypothetical protein ACTS4W_00405 [Candidatus Hodgkinia cicadicola]